jgi:hypothetical protein
MTTDLKNPACVPVPNESAVSGLYKKTQLADAYTIRLPDDVNADPELLARFLFSQRARWVDYLMQLRDMLVAMFGIKTANELENSSGADQKQRISFFKIYSKTKNEILLGEDGKHLDFRLSVLIQRRTGPNTTSPHLILSTAVHCHNFLGHAYIFIISPFHRLIVQSILRRAAKKGWPTCAS